MAPAAAGPRRFSRIQLAILGLVLLVLGLLCLEDNYSEVAASVWQYIPSPNVTAYFIPLPITFSSNAAAPLPPPTVTTKSLPGYCDSCGPKDTFCQLYGPNNLARSRAYEGPNERLKRVIRRALLNNKIKIGVIGGSVTRGHGVVHEECWVTLYADWWHSMFPAMDVQVINGAVPASETDYFQTCFLEHLPKDIDLVIIEMAINDQRLEELAVSYEYLLRGLLELPSKPAVINLQIMALVFDTITMGGDLHTAVAMYYDTPIISLRNLLLPHILRNQNASLDAHWFYNFQEKVVDLRHLNRYGHVLIKDLVASFTQRQICEVLQGDLDSSPGTVDSPWKPSLDGVLPGDETLEYLPRLRLFQKYDLQTVLGPTKTSCQSMKSATHPLTPIAADGWSRWFHDSRPDKVYLRATKPGSSISFRVPTGNAGRIRVTYLRSKSFGLGDVFCWVTSKRNGTILRGWWDRNNVNIGATTVIESNLPPAEHTLKCELLRTSTDPDGGHEFRIIAVDGA